MRRPDPRTGRAAPAPGWQGDRYRCEHRSGSVKGQTIVALRIGYKASAEQFGPRDLVEYAVQAEQVGLDSAVVSDHFLPWRHEGGHAPFALSWMAAVGERTSRIQLGTSVLTPTFRYNPAVLAQDVRHHGPAVPGPGHARRRHRGGAQRDRGVRPGVAGVQGAVRPAARGRPADARAVDRRGGLVRRRLLHDGRRHDLRPARAAGAGVHRRRRPGRRQVRGSGRRRLHLHVRQGHGPLHREAAAGGRGGRSGGGARSVRRSTG